MSRADMQYRWKTYELLVMTHILIFSVDCYIEFYIENKTSKSLFRAKVVMQ